MYRSWDEVTCCNYIIIKVHMKNNENAELFVPSRTNLSLLIAAVKILGTAIFMVAVLPILAL